MTVTSVQFIRLSHVPSGGYVIAIGLRPADSRQFELITAKLDGSPSPRDELAIIVRGHAISSPQVVALIIDGRVQFGGFASRAQGERIFRGL
jgi:hypothetical protein